jgi:hypothetical protein
MLLPQTLKIGLCSPELGLYLRDPSLKEDGKFILVLPVILLGISLIRSAVFNILNLLSEVLECVLVFLDDFLTEMRPLSQFLFHFLM